MPHPWSRRFVRLTHHETGIVVEVDAWATGTRSMHKLVQTAKRILAAKIAAHRRGQYPPREGDRVRTYHTSPYGTWTKEHRSGVRVDGVFLGHHERGER